MLGTLLNWAKIGVMIVIAFVVLGLFVDNAASWGTNAGEVLTAIKRFLTNLMNASPLG